jgi:Domain of unknown function (DUF1905)/Bacteriocin-protection, YdeI or OmpD-Associated
MRYHAPVEDSLHVFSGKIYKVGLIRYVDVPAEVTRKMSAKGAHLPVRGTVEGISVRTTLVSRGKGCYRVAIHGDIRKRLRIDAGTVVEIAIKRDDEPREPVLPPFLVLSLRNSSPAQAAFRNMTTALRRQIVRYLTSVKRQATLERRVAKFVRRLESGTRPGRLKQKSNRNRRQDLLLD